MDSQFGIPVVITMSTSKVTNDDSSSINEITLAIRDNDFQADAQTDVGQKTCTVITPIKDSNSKQKQPQRIPSYLMF